MQRKVPPDVLANVSSGHVPPCGAAQRNVSQPLMITAMGEPATPRYTCAKTQRTHDQRPLYIRQQRRNTSE